MTNAFEHFKEITDIFFLHIESFIQNINRNDFEHFKTNKKGFSHIDEFIQKMNEKCF